jgi:hypothetical protein
LDRLCASIQFPVIPKRAQYGVQKSTGYRWMDVMMVELVGRV